MCVTRIVKIIDAAPVWRVMKRVTNYDVIDRIDIPVIDDRYLSSRGIQVRKLSAEFFELHLASQTYSIAPSTTNIDGNYWYVVTHE